MAQQRLLLQRSTGRIYVWNEPFSKQEDMMEYNGPVPEGGRISPDELKKIIAESKSDFRAISTDGQEKYFGRMVC